MADPCQQTDNIAGLKEDRGVILARLEDLKEDQGGMKKTLETLTTLMIKMAEQKSQTQANAETLKRHEEAFTEVFRRLRTMEQRPGNEARDTLTRTQLLVIGAVFAGINGMGLLIMGIVIRKALGG